MRAGTPSRSPTWPTILGLFVCVSAAHGFSQSRLSARRGPTMALSEGASRSGNGRMQAHAGALDVMRGEPGLYGFPTTSGGLDLDVWSSMDSCEFGGLGVGGLDSLDELVGSITQALRFDVPLMRQMEAKRAMMRANLQPQDYAKYAHFDEAQPYTRNLVATDYDSFILLLLCWSPGEASKIHDHPCEGCWMRVMDGAVEEHLYDQVDDRMLLTGHSKYRKDDVAFVNDCVGFHSIGNPSATQGAMTLHLYSPPFEHCRAWPEKEDATKVLHPAMTFHSQFGKLCN